MISEAETNFCSWEEFGRYMEKRFPYRVSNIIYLARVAEAFGELETGRILVEGEGHSIQVSNRWTYHGFDAVFAKEEDALLCKMMLG